MTKPVLIAVLLLAGLAPDAAAQPQRSHHDASGRGLRQRIERQ